MAANGFTLAFPRRIVFGWEALRDAPREILRCGRRVLLLATRSCGVAAERLEAALRREGADVLRADGPGREPEVADVDRLAAEARARRSEVVVGLGGFAEYGLVTDTRALLEDKPGTDLGYAYYQMPVPAEADILPEDA
ncbi:MAG TPA: iron-containing alcohol dehydrogenase, partial [Planctomycetota bacterium]|nr:iron-containing alcohol dehydrogenase [Planctomycetota bacterium]